MKKFFAIAAIVLLPASAFAQTGAAVQGSTGAAMSTTIARPVDAKVFSKIYRAGDSSSEVKELQEILKLDAGVYPQGLVTGYFGKLTEDALKRLQAKYGLPQTGVLDDATQQVLFPVNVQITVVSPNGGETWDKSQVQMISWKSSFGPLTPSPLGLEGSATRPSIVPFFRHAVVELIQDSNPNFAYHIATVDLTQSRYDWRIPERIPNATDYRIRVSFGRRNICIMMQGQAEANTMIYPSPCPLYPDFWASDTSDGTFTITGATVPRPDPSVLQKLMEQINAMERMLEQLRSQLDTMKSIIQNLRG